ncbi:MAG: response regulator [Dehalococcoidia bacterium]|nr:MAG: response regulator [Dehalococcoidia bacterium]
MLEGWGATAQGGLRMPNALENAATHVQDGTANVALFRAPDMPSGSILVLDDAPEMRSVFVNVLSEDGWEVVATADPDEALRVAREQQLAAVIFDLRLGGSGGTSFYDALRDGGHSLPAILCSAWGEAPEVAASLGVPFVPKPFDIDALLSRVSGAVNGHPSAVLEALPEQQGTVSRQTGENAAR